MRVGATTPVVTLDTCEGRRRTWSQGNRDIAVPWREAQWHTWQVGKVAHRLHVRLALRHGAAFSGRMRVARRAFLVDHLLLHPHLATRVVRSVQLARHCFSSTLHGCARGSKRRACAWTRRIAATATCASPWSRLRFVSVRFPPPLLFGEETPWVRWTSPPLGFVSGSNRDRSGSNRVRDPVGKGRMPRWKGMAVVQLAADEGRRWRRNGAWKWTQTHGVLAREGRHGTCSQGPAVGSRPNGTLGSRRCTSVARHCRGNGPRRRTLERTE